MPQNLLKLYNTPNPPKGTPPWPAEYYAACNRLATPNATGKCGSVDFLISATTRSYMVGDSETSAGLQATVVEKSAGLQATVVRTRSSVERCFGAKAQTDSFHEFNITCSR